MERDEREWDRAGGEAAATGVRGKAGEQEEDTGGDRGAYLDDPTAVPGDEEGPDGA